VSLMRCFRTPFHEETELLSVLRFPYLCADPKYCAKHCAKQLRKYHSIATFAFISARSARIRRYLWN
jgi:hypothetical protein